MDPLDHRMLGPRLDLFHFEDEAPGAAFWHPRDLPLRYAEFGARHRYEPSGSLHGLMRGRAITQDDAHVFCLPEHVEAQVKRFCELLRRVYLRFGFREFAVGLSTRPESREGSDAGWDQVEAMLEAAALGTANGNAARFSSTWCFPQSSMPRSWPPRVRKCDR
jgi:threonyl-tRNA synthetase